MQNKRIRQVKLHSKYRASRSKTWMSDNGHQVPWLNISGNWLAELGFNIGDMVRIIAREQLLIIEPLTDDAQQAVEYKNALKEVKQTILKIAS
ncbi:SymE family type I addiction module toxin [Niabella sp.]|uniref:SymE family type I addiction module toxin n=1 Tax=Niabella sp. TaxID=1962976 RepID=UPI0026114059|nr:SymE family type I addiction module toxin [Niabella sp.]